MDWEDPWNEEGLQDYNGIGRFSNYSAPGWVILSAFESIVDFVEKSTYQKIVQLP